MSTHDPHQDPQHPTAGHEPVPGSNTGYAEGPNSYGQQQGYPQPGYPQPGYHQSGPYGYQQGMQPYGTQPGVPVGFGEAIKRFFAKYAQFSGRASRSEYWWVALFFFLISFGVNTLITTVGTDSSAEANGLGIALSLAFFLFALGTLVPSIAVAVRRLHDVNLSGWFMLIGLIPFVGWIVVLVFALMGPRPEGARFDR